MRTQDAKLFSEALEEILASRPVVLDSVNEYLKNCDQMKGEALKDIGKFSNDTYRELVEFLRKNADVKGLVLEIVKLVDKFDFIAEASFFLIKESFKAGNGKTVIEILDGYFEDSVILYKVDKDENNNENNGH